MSTLVEKRGEMQNQRTNGDSRRDSACSRWPEGLSLYFLSVLDEHLTASVPYLRAVSLVKHPRTLRADLRQGRRFRAHPSAVPHTTVHPSVFAERISSLDFPATVRLSWTAWISI